MKSERRTAWRAELGLALLAFACFAPSLLAGFVYDDVLLIAQNPYAQSFEYLSRAFTTHFWDTAGRDSTELLRYYRPLVSASYLVDWRLGSGAPWLFHLTNTLLHSLAVLLAARFTRRIFRGSLLWLLPTLVFAFHPTRIESVVWVAGRTDLMMTVGMLLSVEAAAMARRSSDRPWLALSAASAILALLCKEIAVVTPLLIVADRSVEAHRRPAKAKPAAAGYGDVAMVGLACAGYLLVRHWLMPLGNVSRELTPATFLAALEGYAQRLLWPWPQSSFLRPLVVGEAGFVHPIWQIAGGALVLLGCLALLALSARRQRPAFWFLVTALVSLAPVLHFVPTGLPVLVSDRFWYFPLLPLAIGLTLFFERALRQLLELRLGLLIVGLGCLPMAAVIALSIPKFLDDESFWSEELALDPCNPAAHDFAANRAAAAGKLALAQQHLARALSTACIGETLAHRQLPLRAYGRLLQLEAARTADGNLNKLTRLRERLSQLYAGKPTPVPPVPDLPQPAEPFFRKLQKEPRRLPEPGNTAAELAMLETRLGRDRAAERSATAALSSDVSQLAAPANLVLTLARLEHFERAGKLVHELLEAEPRPLLNRQQSLDLQQRLSQASAQLDAAKHASAQQSHLLSAQAQATLGAYGRALRRFEPAYRADPRPAISVLYAQLLVAARLEGQAYQVLTATVAPERAQRMILQLRNSLSPDLRAIPSVDASPVP